LGSRRSSANASAEVGERANFERVAQLPPKAPAPDLHLCECERGLCRCRFGVEAPVSERSPPSAPELLEQVHRVTTLPLDFDIFLRFGVRAPRPEIARVAPRQLAVVGGGERRIVGTARS